MRCRLCMGLEVCRTVTDHYLQLLYEIKLITGVVEVGLFCKMARACYFGNEVRSMSNVQVASSTH